MDTILQTIKKMLGIGDDDDSFDTDILVLINSAASSLRQLGVGPQNGLEIDDGTGWEDLLDDEEYAQLLPSAKEYIYIKVRQIFDTPTGPAAEAYSNRLSEIEWRMCSELDRIKGI